jgi:hypothetical protein
MPGAGHVQDAAVPGICLISNVPGSRWLHGLCRTRQARLSLTPTMKQLRDFSRSAPLAVGLTLHNHEVRPVPHVSPWSPIDAVPDFASTRSSLPPGVRHDLAVAGLLRSTRAEAVLADLVEGMSGRQDRRVAHQERHDLAVRSGMLVAAHPAHEEVPRHHV